MKNSHLNDSSAKRKEEKKTKRLFWLAVACAVAVVALIFALDFQRMVAPFEGIGHRLNRSGESDAGFPVRLPGSASYSINPFGNGFMLLTETYIYTYSSDGRAIYANQHGYSFPVTAVSDRRILVYDENGRKFSFFGRNAIIYEKEIGEDDRIIYGAIGDNDRAVIVYRNASHANVLEIYDGSGDWKYTKRFFGENIMQVAFTASDNDIIVTSIGFGTGNFDSWDTTAVVQRFDTSSDESALWRTELPANTLPFAVYAARSNVFVLSDNALFVLDSSDGKIIGRYNYRGNLLDYAFSDEAELACVLLVDNYTAGTLNLISIDRSAELIGIIDVSSGASQVQINAGEVYVLEPGLIVQYSSNLTQPEITVLSEEFSRFIYVRGEILLLGYNCVERLGDELHEYNEENE
jgi:hypothetical protein